MLSSRVVAFTCSINLLHALALPQASNGSAPTDVACTYLTNAETALDYLQTFYNESDGLWHTNWWQSANQLTTVANMVDGGSEKASNISASLFPNIFTQAQDYNIVNNHNTKRQTETPWTNSFYDDEGWWAMAWIRVYDVTGNETYLEASKGLFDDMTTGWGTNCSSAGIWWDKPHTVIAQISNALFLEVAAWLANRVPDNKQYYVDWAEREWQWLVSPEGQYLPDVHFVGPNIDVQTCTYPDDREDKIDFTYTQGSLLSGLVELAVATSNDTYLQEANAIANATMSILSNNGVLQDRIDQANPGGSAPQFKGVFMRALQRLYSASPDPEYQAFAQRCADSIWNNDRQDSALGVDWNGPFYDNDPEPAGAQSSAMDALVAAWILSE